MQSLAWSQHLRSFTPCQERTRHTLLRDWRGIPMFSNPEPKDFCILTAWLLLQLLDGKHQWSSSNRVNAGWPGSTPWALEEHSSLLWERLGPFCGLVLGVRPSPPATLVWVKLIFSFSACHFSLTFVAGLGLLSPLCGWQRLCGAISDADTPVGEWQPSQSQVRETEIAIWILGFQSNIQKRHSTLWKLQSQ